jgi:hypothetical protein
VRTYTLVMLTPVMPSTTSGIFSITSNTSRVRLAAQTSPSPQETMEIFLVFVRGAAISAAICNHNAHLLSALFLLLQESREKILTSFFFFGGFAHGH